MSVRVLLVDEAESARAGLAQRLERSAGLAVVGAVADAGEAAGLLSNGHIDVVLLDLHQGDVIGTCEALCRLTDAPVVLLASFMTPERWASAQRAGAADYLLKRIDTEWLRRSLERIVERRRSRHAAPAISGGGSR